MPEVHLPHLDDHDDELAAPSPIAPTPRSRGKGLFKLALEVVLISSGVFLGLAGEQWRESRHEHQLAQAALRRFQTEIAANRKAVAANDGYHATLKSDLSAWLKADARTRPTLTLHMDRSLAPVFFEHSAWDLALATQSLVHIDEDLAFELSRLYRMQQGMDTLQTAIVQSTVYTRSPKSDAEDYFTSLNAFLGDVTYIEPLLLKMYDELQPKIDAALRE